MYRKYFWFSRQIAKPLLYWNQSTLLDLNCGNLLSKRWAGHSKWQNVKSTKEAAEKNRNAVFHKIIQKVITAVKEGGADVAGNSKLRALIEEAKKANMPKSTLERAIKLRNSQTGDKSFWVVFSNPKGLVLGIEVNFANNKPGFIATKLGTQFKKVNLKMETHFSHLCNERGLIFTDPLENVNDAYEKALEDGIEIGVEEVHQNEDKSFIFECFAERLDSTSLQLSKKGYNIQSTSKELDFKTFIKLNEEEINELEKIIAKVQSQFDEVIRTTYNVVQS